MGKQSIPDQEHKGDEGGHVGQAPKQEERTQASGPDVEMLRLAAYCGDTSAISALGDEAPKIPEDLEQWFLGFEAWGKKILVRAAIVAAKHALKQAPLHSPDDKCVQKAIQAAEHWLENPCSTNMNAAKRAARSAMDQTIRRASDLVDPPWLACRVWPNVPLTRAMGSAACAAGSAGHEGSETLKYAADAVMLSVQQTVRPALCEALIRWALAE